MKEAWKEQIVTQLTLIHKSHMRKFKESKFTSVDTDAIRNRYHARPALYVKIIRARDLISKDIGGTSDPYVEITVGASKEKTTTRKKTLNPEWGMVFKFDWDFKDRYVKIEVW